MQALNIQHSYESFGDETSQTAADRKNYSRSLWMLALVAAVVLVATMVILKAPLPGGGVEVTSSFQTASTSDSGVIAKKCLTNLRNKLFAEGLKGRDSKTGTFLLDQAKLIQKGAQIHMPDGTASAPLVDPQKWSKDMEDRMDMLHFELTHTHKHYPATRLGIAVVYNNHDVITVDPDDCVLTGIYFGNAKDETFHPLVMDDLVGVKEDRWAPCLTCGQSYSGVTTGSSTGEEVFVIFYSPLSRLEITSCSPGSGVMNLGMALYEVAPSPAPLVKMSQSCPFGQVGRRIVQTDILQTSSQPIGLEKFFELRLSWFPLTALTPFDISIECTCANLRRDWLDLTSGEQALYANGYKRLRSNGKLGVFTSTHDNGINFVQAHGTSAFFPWHRYFIWELERQIRNEGGNYACYTLSYWDWTRFSAEPETDDVFTTVMGGNGGGSDNCVMTGAFTAAQGYTPSSGGTCLTRNFRTTWTLATSQNVVRWVCNTKWYRKYRIDVEENNGMHDFTHTFFRGFMGGGTSPDDPMFFLVHTFVDFLWAMWQDCHDYDLETTIRLRTYRGTAGNDDGPNDILLYNVLDGESWAAVSSENLTPTMLNWIDRDFFASDPYSFQESDILARSGLDTSDCSFHWISTAVASDAVDNRVMAKKLGAQSVKFPSPPVSPLTRTVDLDVKRLRSILQRSHPKWTAVQLNDALAKHACEEQRRLSHRECKFNPNYEKCPGKGELKISLEALLNKKGVKGNACLTDNRKAFYEWAKRRRNLRGLCNGVWDPMC